MKTDAVALGGWSSRCDTVRDHLPRLKVSIITYRCIIVSLL